MDEKELEALKASSPKAYESYMALKSENDKLKATPPPKKDDPPNPDPEKEKSLADKARLEREDNEKKKAYEKNLGSALKFNMGAQTFLKENAGLLPKTAEGIFAAAEKSKYESEIEKANEIKVGLVSEFFSVQSNVDHLTGSQKVELEDFLKLTKNKQQERIDTVYSMIFEPTLESIRKVEKAKEVQNGSKSQTDQEKMLADRMMKQAKKHYLGDKE